MGIKATTYYLFILLTPLLFSSCAVLLNKKFQHIRIYCDSTLKINKIEKAVRTLDLDSMPAYQVKRSRKPLAIEFKLKDSSLVNYKLRSGLSKEFIFGNAPLYLYGYLIDIFYPEKFQYPPKNYFSYDTLKHKVVHSRTLPFNKKDNLIIGIGWTICAYHSSLFKSFDGAATPFGLNLQLEYFFRGDGAIFFELGVAGTTADNRRPHFNRRDPPDSLRYNYSQNYWFLLTYRYHFGRWGFGAGISFSPSTNTNEKYYITRRDTVAPGYPDSTYLIVSKPKINIQTLQKTGLALNIDYNITPKVSAGMNWHIFVKDLNKGTGFYSSHFLNFYLNFKPFRIKTKKSVTKHEYY